MPLDRPVPAGRAPGGPAPNGHAQDSRPLEISALELAPLDLAGPVWGAFTTRAGGASRPPFAGLNLSATVGDDPADVQANRARLRVAAGLAALVLAGQVHGAKVAVVDGRCAGRTMDGVDALVTDTAGIGLVVLAADCLPVLLADAAAGVVAVAHAGRPGLVAGVLSATLAAMARLGADPARVQARLGTAVCGLCYELPAELADEVGRQVPGSRSTTRAGQPSVDLVAGARAQLAAAGVPDVQGGTGCTMEQADRFSYRRDRTTGRHAGVIALRRP